jgi:hypothetical protein
MIKRFTKTLTANFDDKQVVELMKKHGAWETMKPESLIPNRGRVFTKGDYIFQWCACPIDGGYTAFHSTNRAELAALFIQLRNMDEG